MDMIQQEIEQEKQLSKIDDMNGEINPYRELIVNNMERTEPLMLYNILLPINCYIGNNTTKHHSKSMSDNRDLTETLHQKIFLTS